MLTNPLANAAVGCLGASRRRKRSSGVVTLMLTSLVDAFSILVIYLLFNSSTAGDLLYLSKDMELPTAHQAVELVRNVVVKVEGDKLFIEDEEVSPQHLVKRLIDLKDNWLKYYPGTEFSGAMTIQADRRQTYDLLSSVVQAGSHAGYSDINFAVVRN